MKPPFVSIVIPSYNAEEFIAETIESIIRQTYRQWELLIIDDGSTDSSAKIIKKYTQKDPRIKYFYQQNASQAVARNQGIREAAGELVAFCDADDVWLPNKLEQQIPLLQNPEIGFSYTGVRQIDKNSKLIGNRPPQLLLQGNVFLDIIYTNFITTSTVMVKKKILTEHNFYFRTQRQGTEDWDLWIRLATITSCACIPEALVLYRVYPGSESSKLLNMHFSRMKTLEDLEQDICTSKLSQSEKKHLMKIIGKSRSIHILRSGHEFLARGDKKMARQFFSDAIAINPLSLRNYWGLIKSLLT